ncbi:MAG TPA: NAD-dependent epimerase/dehydratase family protein [Bryobacteraceae bacterium]|nr:NAD-dependent epimerase/dehydratase family protein [Bryobacteraceae bacterium]
MPDHILITGGAGFIGSTIAFELKRRFPGADITALDNLRRRGSELNVPRLAARGIRFVHGDVRQPADLDSLPADLIVECSADPSAQAGYNGAGPEYAVETNLFGCYNCLNLARRNRADFIFLSSSRVYPVGALNRLTYRQTETRFEWMDEQPVAGASQRGISEAFPTDGVRSIYGMTKLAAELMIQEYADAYGFRFVINRCGLVAGPWQMGKADQGVVTHWLAAHHYGRPLRYIGFGGEGRQVRDVMHADDLADLVAMQAGSPAAFDGQTFNVSGGRDFSVSLLELTRLCEQVTGRSIAIGSEPGDRPADLRIFVGDTRLIRTLHGWRPQRGPEIVLRDTYQWIRTHQDEAAYAFRAEPG